MSADRKAQLKRLIQLTTLAAKMKAGSRAVEMRRAVAAQVHVKQFEDTENSIVDFVSPLFNEQVESAIKRLREIKSPKLRTKTPEDAASNLVKQIFDPSEWDEELVNRMLPPLAVGAAEAMVAQLRILGLRVGKNVRLRYKESTATEWLRNQEDVDLEDAVFVTPQGNVTMQIATEFPPWMKEAIERNLKETFEQDFWVEVNETTSGDIESVLEQGIRDGESIENMARSMEGRLLEQGIYARRRARTIARTESSHSLNGARSETIDGLIDEVGGDVPIGKEWLSVLGNTTRDTHAALDGVPADSEGMWTLAGVRTRWPGDTRLPVGERANCQCTVSTTFGIEESEARRRIQEGSQRLQAIEEQ